MRKNAVRMRAGEHQTVVRKRRDPHFKEAKKPVVRFRSLMLENLNIKNMVRDYHLAKSINDVGWTQSISITASKTEEAGVVLKW